MWKNGGGGREVKREGGEITGREDRMLFLSQLFEATGFSCHIQKEDSVEVGQMRGKGMLDVL